MVDKPKKLSVGEVMKSDAAGAPYQEGKKFIDAKKVDKPKKEIGGPQGPEPTRFGDWEKKGRCSDF